MNLKAHIRTCHKELAKQLDEEGWPARLESGSAHDAVDEDDERQMSQEILLEAQGVEQGEAQMVWATGEQVVQLAHGDSFPAGKTNIFFCLRKRYYYCNHIQLMYGHFTD